MDYGRLLRRFAGLAVRKPTLAWPMLAAAWRFRRRDWYRMAPFVPVPPREYVAWRLHTAYGDEAAVPRGEELARYLRWARWMRKPAPSRDRHGE